MTGQVLLITMPFGPMTRPAIGISLLQAELAAEGVGCDIRYLNLEYARLVGVHTYHDLSEELPTASLFGDWLFHHLIREADPRADAEYIENHLPRWYPTSFDPSRIELYRDCRALSEPFVERCLADLDLDRYSVVGFTTTFQQTVPSLALAKRIKQDRPAIHVAFGGANCEGVMGQELLRSFPFIDAVFSGEADISFPRYVKAILSGVSQVAASQGLTRRADLAGAQPAAASGPPAALDALPWPDYRDFDAALDSTGLRGQFNLQYLIETSRGCWWGERHHCTFCGLNGQTMRYRSKEPDRVLAELAHLQQDHHAEVVWGTDNILDHHYFGDLLPQLAANPGPRLFFETKANLRKEQVKLMRDAGLNWFQPGIESLNTHQLTLMRKGITALQNIQVLKWAREFGMSVTWNMLMGFPGETEADYRLAANYCERIEHLQPPAGAHPIRLDRFSPLYDESETFGLCNIEPFPSYGYVYGLDDDALRRLAYFFTFDYADSYDPISTGRPLLEAVRHWSHPDSMSVFYAFAGAGTMLLCDTRTCAFTVRRLLVGWQADVYRYTDTLHSRAAIHRYCRARHPGVSAADIDGFLADAVSNNIMLCENDTFLSLAVIVPAGQRPAAIRDQRIPDSRASQRARLETVRQ